MGDVASRVPPTPVTALRIVPRGEPLLPLGGAGVMLRPPALTPALRIAQRRTATRDSQQCRRGARPHDRLNPPEPGAPRPGVAGPDPGASRKPAPGARTERQPQCMRIQQRMVPAGGLITHW